MCVCVTTVKEETCQTNSTTTRATPSSTQGRKVPDSPINISTVFSTDLHHVSGRKSAPPPAPPLENSGKKEREGHARRVAPAASAGLPEKEK